MPILKTVRLTPHFSHCSSAPATACNVATGPALKPSMPHAQRVALRHRLAASADPAGDEADSPVFDLPVETVMQRLTKKPGNARLLSPLPHEAGL
jgi:hypothetical protein